MKLPRWSVVLLLGLTAVAVVAAVALFWITWPEKTAREFIALIGTGRFEEANRFRGLSPDQDDRLLFPWEPEYKLWRWEQQQLKPQSRSLADLVLGRQEFIVAAEWYWFRVERGKVVKRGVLNAQ